jgi:hypothetical protein
VAPLSVEVRQYDLLFNSEDAQAVKGWEADLNAVRSATVAM